MRATSACMPTCILTLTCVIIVKSKPYLLIQCKVAAEMGTQERSSERTLTFSWEITLAPGSNVVHYIEIIRQRLSFTFPSLPRHCTSRRCHVTAHHAITTSLHITSLPCHCTSRRCHITAHHAAATPRRCHITAHHTAVTSLHITPLSHHCTSRRCHITAHHAAVTSLHITPLLHHCTSRRCHITAQSPRLPAGRNLTHLASQLLINCLNGRCNHLSELQRLLSAEYSWYMSQLSAAGR